MIQASKTPRAQGTMDPTNKTDNPELASVRHIMDLLDRAFRNARIYGATNPTSQRFIDQFYNELTSHLTSYDSLSFVVQGFRLLCKGAVVYENPAPTENLAFKLFSDGVRELSLARGLSKEDIVYLLETLGGEYGTVTSDEDIVSRLWEKNLPTISLVTAEEIMKSLDTASAITPQDSNSMNSSGSEVTNIHGRESTRRAQQTSAGTRTEDTGKARAESDLAQYQISQEALDKLAREIEEESARKDSDLLITMLTAILMSEQSPPVLLKALAVSGEVLEKLIRQCDWKLLNKVLDLLQEVERRTDITAEHRNKLLELYERIAQPPFLNGIATALNSSSRINTDGLLTFLLQLKALAVPALCTLLGMLRHPEHRSVISEVLVVLAKDAPEPLFERLNHPTGAFVMDLINVLMRLTKSSEQQMVQYEETYSNVAVPLTEKVADALAQVAQHQDTQIKKEAIRVISALRPTGNGIPLLAFVPDSTAVVRQAALKQLASGRYTVPFSAWLPIISRPAFLNWYLNDKRTTFLAMSQTAGAAAVPYYRELLTRWSWVNRKQMQELAELAADCLVKVGTPEAILALTAGLKSWNPTIRRVCSIALATAQKPSRTTPPATSSQLLP
jgi:hypothetical protein